MSLKPKYNILGKEEMRGFSMSLDALGKEIARNLGDDPTYIGMLEKAAQPILAQIRINIIISAKHPTEIGSGGLADAIGLKPYGGIGYASVSFGWRAIKTKHKGRRKAVSAATYGPILEFSEKRQVRHLYDGFDAQHQEATNILQKLLNGLIDSKL